MATTTVNATGLAYYVANSQRGTGQARQGVYNDENYNGSMTFNFSGIGDLTNIDITSITLSFHVGTVGGSYSKYLYLRYGGRRGNSVGNYSFSSCYNANKSITFSASKNTAGFDRLKTYIEGITENSNVYLGVWNSGNSRGGSSGKTFDYDYMNITSASLALTYTSKKSVGSIGAAQTGSNAVLNITSYNSDYTHKTTWILGENQEIKNVAAGVTTSSFEIPHGWLPNSTSGIATVVLETFNSSNISLGTNSYDFEVTVPSNILPSITTVTVVPDNTAITQATEGNTSGWGLYIQNWSKVVASIDTASAGSGASISSYSISTDKNIGMLPDQSHPNEFSSGIITTPGSIEFTVTVTDTRGRSVTLSPKPTITVYSYSPPTFGSSFTFYRCDENSQRRDTDGQFALLTATFACSSINGNNSLLVHKVTINNADYTLNSGEATRIGAGALSIDQSYDAVITIKDALYSISTYKLTLPSAKYIMHIRQGGRSIGVFRSAGDTDDTLHMGGTLKLYSALAVNDSTVGSGTCANIGAVKKSGDTMTSWLNFDTSDSTKEFGIVFNVPNSENYRIYPTKTGADLNFVHDGTNPDFSVAAMSIRGSDNSVIIGNTTLGTGGAIVSNLSVVNSLYAANPTQARTSIQAALGTYTENTELDTGCAWGSKRIYRYSLSGSITTSGDVNIGTMPHTPTAVVAITGSYKDSNTNNWRPIGFTSYYNLTTSSPHTFTAWVKGDDSINLVIGSGLTGTKYYYVSIDYTID